MCSFFFSSTLQPAASGKTTFTFKTRTVHLGDSSELLICPETPTISNKCTYTPKKASIYSILNIEHVLEITHQDQRSQAFDARQCGIETFALMSE